MPRFFLEEVGERSAIIYGDDARHILRSLRMEVGDEVTLCDMRGFDYSCKIEDTGYEMVRLRILNKEPSVTETVCRLRLFQALPKADKMEFIVQKATELGVDEIIPVVSARCISRPTARSGNMGKKAERWQRIAQEAAKQSGRGRIPRVTEPVSFEDAVCDMKQSELALLCYEECTEPLHNVLTGKPAGISIMVGSEGGFSPKEAEYAMENGVQCASLGRRILRCETAPLCALSAILFYLGEF